MALFEGKLKEGVAVCAGAGVGPKLNLKPDMIDRGMGNERLVVDEDVKGIAVEPKCETRPTRLPSSPRKVAAYFVTC